MGACSFRALIIYDKVSYFYKSGDSFYGDEITGVAAALPKVETRICEFLISPACLCLKLRVHSIQTCSAALSGSNYLAILWRSLTSDTFACFTVLSLIFLIVTSAGVLSISFVLFSREHENWRSWSK